MPVLHKALERLSMKMHEHELSWFLDTWINLGGWYLFKYSFVDLQ